MPLKIDIRKDPFCQKGKTEGIEEKSHLIVVNLLDNTDFDDKKIALIAAVSLEFVRSVRKNAGL